MDFTFFKTSLQVSEYQDVIFVDMKNLLTL